MGSRTACLRPRPVVFEAKVKASSLFEAKAKANSLWGQGQFSSRSRPVLFEAEARASIFEVKAKASDHDCWKKYLKNDISRQNPMVKLTTKRLSKHKLSTKLSLSLHHIA